MVPPLLVIVKLRVAGETKFALPTEESYSRVPPLKIKVLVALPSPRPPEWKTLIVPSLMVVGPL